LAAIWLNSLIFQLNVANISVLYFVFWLSNLFTLPADVISDGEEKAG
jgi:hypothetical protein